tara:strand:- start:873 stop:1091 length:219 start_codon:yes stop_codon:yes gene_type:complete
MSKALSAFILNDYQPLQKLREDIIELIFLKPRNDITDEEILNKIKDLQCIYNEETEETHAEKMSRWALDHIS